MRIFYLCQNFELAGKEFVQEVGWRLLFIEDLTSETHLLGARFIDIFRQMNGRVSSLKVVDFVQSCVECLIRCQSLIHSGEPTAAVEQCGNTRALVLKDRKEGIVISSESFRLERFRRRGRNGREREKELKVNEQRR